jgi:hypothetical protein
MSSASSYYSQLDQKEGDGKQTLIRFNTTLGVSCGLLAITHFFNDPPSKGHPFFQGKSLNNWELVLKVRRFVESMFWAKGGK